MMTAYEICEKKIQILTEINYLNREVAGNNTETVLFSNDEVNEIINHLNTCITMLDEALKAKN